MKDTWEHLKELIAERPLGPEPQFLMTAPEFEYFNAAHKERYGTDVSLDASRSFRYCGARYTVAR